LTLRARLRSTRDKAEAIVANGTAPLLTTGVAAFGSTRPPLQPHSVTFCCDASAVSVRSRRPLPRNEALFAEQSTFWRDEIGDLLEAARNGRAKWSHGNQIDDNNDEYQTHQYPAEHEVGTLRLDHKGPR
jgi:hypothetical protein